MKNKSRQIIYELYIGIAIHTVFFGLLGIFLMRPYLWFLAGLVVGGAVSCLCILLLYEDLDRALDMDNRGAQRFVMVRGIARLVLRVLLMAGAIWISWTCFYGVAVGLMSTKVAGYLHTFISKKITKTYVPSPTEVPEDVAGEPQGEPDDEVEFDDIEGRMDRL